MWRCKDNGKLGVKPNLTLWFIIHPSQSNIDFHLMLIKCNLQEEVFWGNVSYISYAFQYCKLIKITLAKKKKNIAFVCICFGPFVKAILKIFWFSFLNFGRSATYYFDSINMSHISTSTLILYATLGPFKYQTHYFSHQYSANYHQKVPFATNLSSNCQEIKIFNNIVSNRRKMRQTESTDAITDTTHITTAIFQWKTGVPHCSG